MSHISSPTSRQNPFAMSPLVFARAPESPDLSEVEDLDKENSNPFAYQVPASEPDNFMDFDAEGSASNSRPVLGDLYRKFRPEDMLGTEEHMEGKPCQPPFIARLVKCLHMCIVGCSSGVFLNREVATKQVKGIPGGYTVVFYNVGDAFAAWSRACLQGKVTAPVHEDSIFRIVVAKHVLEQRAEAATLDARLRAHHARRAVAAAGRLVNTATRSTEGATGRFCDPVADRAPASFSPEVLMGSGFDGPSGFSAPPSPSPILSSPIASSYSTASLTQGLPNEDTIGFVVVKGRRPGVYSCPEDWERALAKGAGGWAFCFSSTRLAALIFAKFEDEAEVIE